ncbi:MAG: 3-hydroxyacyl-ACP dehydratase FabZ [Candidatus Dasytiphilus stammeri]
MANKNNIFQLEEILELLPHRFPFLLIDRMLSFEKGHFLRVVKNVSFNEPFFQGHFPNKPIFPGVLIIEAMAQATGILAFRSWDKLEQGELYYLTSIDKARFKRQVFPGDQMILEVEFIKERSRIALFRGIAKVNNKLVCKASLMCTRRLKT